MVLKDTTISKPWGNEEMKNPDEKVNIGAFRNAKAVFSGEGVTHQYVNTQGPQSHILMTGGPIEVHIL